MLVVVGALAACSSSYNSPDNRNPGGTTPPTSPAPTSPAPNPGGAQYGNY
jgi:hypothetical protein